MGVIRRPGVLAVYGIGCFLIIFSGFGISATRTDVNCLKKIRESVTDPNGHLDKTWDFSNKTEGAICRFTGIDCWNPDESRVLNITLTNMGLMGEFPLGLEGCTSLSGLNLTGNKFTGPIPSNISELIPFLTTLDLSANNFSGEIPVTLADCIYLNDIRLDHNQLSGQIPLQLGLLGRVKSLNVANDNLLENVPVFNTTINVDDCTDTSGLCGPPVELPPGPTSDDSSEGMDKSGIVMAVVVIVVVLAVVGGVFACVYILKDF